MATGDKKTETGLRYIWGILLPALCLFIALSLFSYDWRDIGLRMVPPNDPPCNLIGPAGAWMAFAFFTLFGVGAYLFPLWCIVFGLILIFSREERIWPKAIWCVVLMLALVCILHLHGVGDSIRDKLNIGEDICGVFGWIMMESLLVKWISKVGAGILVWSLFLASLVMLVRIPNFVRGYRYAGGLCRVLTDGFNAFVSERQGKRRLIEKEERRIEKRRRRLEKTIRMKEHTARTPRSPAPDQGASAETGEAGAPDHEGPGEEARITSAPVTAPAGKKTAARKQGVKEETTPGPEEEHLPAGSVMYEIPPVDLLEELPPSGGKSIKADTGTMSRILVETLAEFGIEVEVVNVETGPVVTRYELMPAPGVRVEKISGLSNNLALSLKATSVRVQAPIPGKGVVGIEVPNLTAKMVYLREIIEGEKWQENKAKLPLVLGKDVSGNDLTADLASMPHLLIAGATGTGKTVCMNSILAGLLMSRTPDQLRLMLVDPKIVEFSVYSHLPHLVVPVITNPKKVALGLRWAINEMEKRYKLFASVGVRDIEGYNNRVVPEQTELFGGEPDEGKEKKTSQDSIPYIVIIIDELADLMLADQAEIENCVARLAQLSRAVGIHMIISTQRPSVNVITGTIKANFPARIAFQVAQKVDSRTILDTIGADKLLGRGDMLFLPPGTSRLVRAQGAMTMDNDIRNIVEFIKNQAEPDYVLEIKEKLDKPAGKLGGDEDDELLMQAIEIIRETRRASTSSLQRRLRIGYTRAARIMDILQERGIVGEPRGSDPREILIDLDGEIPDNPVEETEEK